MNQGLLRVSPDTEAGDAHRRPVPMRLRALSTKGRQHSTFLPLILAQQPLQDTATQMKTAAKGRDRVDPND